MRKADYSALADIIRSVLEPLGADLADRCTRITVVSIVRRFAERASVDKPAFLKACGIE